MRKCFNFGTNKQLIFKITENYPTKNWEMHSFICWPKARKNINLKRNKQKIN